MATPQRALEIEAERAEILKQVGALKAKSRALKEEYDTVILEARAMHRLSGMTDAEKNVIRQLL